MERKTGTKKSFKKQYEQHKLASVYAAILDLNPKKPTQKETCRYCWCGDCDIHDKGEE